MSDMRNTWQFLPLALVGVKLMLGLLALPVLVKVILITICVYYVIILSYMRNGLVLSYMCNCMICSVVVYRTHRELAPLFLLQHIVDLLEAILFVKVSVTTPHFGRLSQTYIKKTFFLGPPRAACLVQSLLLSLEAQL